MSELAVGEVGNRLAEAIELARRGEPVYMIHRGQRVAVLLDAATYDALVQAAENAVDRAELVRVDDGYLPWGKGKTDLGLQPNSNGLTLRRTPTDGGSSSGPEALMAADVPLQRPESLGEGAPKRSTVSLVIPAKNEARNLATVLGEVPSCVDEVILVDGRSSDVTAQMAQSCRPDIRILSDAGPGKGNALRAGFEAAAGDFIVAMDSDGSMSPREIPQFVYFLENGYDFVKGSRFVGGGGSLDITRLRRIGNRGLLAVANFLYQVQLTDLCYGFFAFRRQYLAHLDLRSPGFEIETEMTVRALVSGLRVAEVPSLEMPRRSGRSSLHVMRDGQRVLRILLQERLGGPRSQPRAIGTAPSP